MNNQELRTKSILKLTQATKHTYRYTSLTRHASGMLARNPKAITLNKGMFIASPPPFITLTIEAEWPQGDPDTCPVCGSPTDYDWHDNRTMLYCLDECGFEIEKGARCPSNSTQ